MLLFVHPKSGQELADANLILYTLIKINKTGGMYNKSLKHLNAKEINDRNTWATFRQHMIAEFKKLIVSGAGTTLGQ